MKLISNNFQELRQNKKLLFISLVILIFSQFLLQYKEIIWPKLYMGLALIAFLVLLSFCRLNDDKKIARNTFILIAVMGSLNALMLPIKGNLDETSHYFHALDVADGKVQKTVSEKNFHQVSPDFSAVAKLPIKPVKEINTNLYHKEFLSIKHKPADYKPKLLDGDGSLNNPAYIPSALGIKAGQLISNKVAVSYYLGRIFNLLFYAFLAWLAVKISRYYKIQLFVLAVLPYTLWVTAGFSYDSLYYGLILLLLAQITNFLEKDKKITLKEIFFYCLTCLSLVFCKAPTILLVILPIFLTSKHFYSKKNYWISTLFVLVTVGFGGLWVIQSTILNMFKNLFQGSSSVVTAAEATASDSRLSYFIADPMYSLEVLLRSVFEILNNVIEFIQRPQIFMMSTGSLREINTIGFIILFLLTTMLVKVRMSRKLTYSLLILFGIITFGIIYAISGDPRVFNVGDLHVNGVQGRYHYYILGFMPLLLAPMIQKLSIFKDNLVDVMNEEKVILFTMKAVFIITLINSSVAVYGYL